MRLTQNPRVEGIPTRDTTPEEDSALRNARELGLCHRDRHKVWHPDYMGIMYLLRMDSK